MKLVERKLFKERIEYSCINSNSESSMKLVLYSLISENARL